MGLRPRRNVVVWRQSGKVGETSPARRQSRARRMCKLMRIGLLLALLPLMRGVRARWRPLLAGTALTVTGVVLRDSTVGSMALLPGLLLLLSAPVFAGGATGDGTRHPDLERELASYVTHAQRFDLEARLDQYPDDVTQELRDILAGQADCL
jgi:hypothetical protein